VRNQFSIVVAVLAVLATDATASAQSFEAGAHVVWSQWSEFKGTDWGIGGRLTWKPMSSIGVDAGLTWYPSDFPPDRISFSGSRVEGLLGVTIGPRVNRIRPFAKAAAGFLKVAQPPEAFACVAIFPPPLACQMASGPTMQALEIGGGVELSTTTSSFVRVDVADRMLKYPGPTFDENFERRDDGFWGHGLRFTLGAGVRF